MEFNENIENKESEGIENKENEKIAKTSEAKLYEKIIGIVVVIAIVVLSAAFVVLKQTLDYKNKIDQYVETYKEEYAELQDFSKVIGEINSLYERYSLDPDTDYSKSEELALLFYVSALNDKYATYISPENNEKLNARRNEDSVTGIGVEVVAEEDGLYVSGVTENSPAYTSGIEIGDYIVGANNIKYSKENSDEFIDSIRGEIGTDVGIEINRQGENINLNIARGTFDTKSITYRIINNDIGIIKIKLFGYKTAEEFKETIFDLKSKGINKFIFDLRNNTGGFLDSVVPVLDTLLPRCKIVEIGESKLNDNEIYMSDPSEITGDMVVLVNENTASAAELFTAVLKEYNKAKVVGNKTFGKGTVVSEFSLSNGGKIVLSTALYYTPLGNNIEGKGVEPDYEVDLPDNIASYKITDENDTQLIKAIELLQ